MNITMLSIVAKSRRQFVFAFVGEMRTPNVCTACDGNFRYPSVDK